MPAGSPGEIRATFRAPAAPGIYQVTASGDGFTANAPLVVASDVARSGGDDMDLLHAVVESRGGSVIPESRLDELAPALVRAIRPQPRLETWHPMRSAWWILPFAFALGGEWFIRRRSGFA
jgi:hypothetical protein